MIAFTPYSEFQVAKGVGQMYAGYVWRSLVVVMWEVVRGYAARGNSPRTLEVENNTRLTLHPHDRASGASASYWKPGWSSGPHLEGCHNYGRGERKALQMVYWLLKVPCRSEAHHVHRHLTGWSLLVTWHTWFEGAGKV